MRILPWSLALVGVGTTIVAARSLTRERPAGPGRLVAVQEMVVWSPSTPDAGKSNDDAESRFEVLNTGGRPVQVISVESGCGCAKPEVSPTLIEPGSKATVIVRATPFPVGERTVPIVLNTDSPISPKVRLSFKMIGTRKPPFLLTAGGNLTFTGSRSATDVREMTVDTIEFEKPGPAPVVRCDVPSARIEQTKFEQKPYTDAKTVIRHRTYRVTLEAPPGGMITGTVSVIDPWDPGVVNSIALYCPDHSDLRAIPTSVTLTLGRDREASAKFVVLSSDPPSQIRVDPRGVPVRIERLDSEPQGRSAVFAIRWLGEPPTASADYSLSIVSPSRPEGISLPIKVTTGQGQ